MKSLVTHPDQKMVLERITVPSHFFSRAKGLLGRSGLADNEGMFFFNCRSIHMWFMRFPIDVVFFDGQMKIQDLRPELKPWGAATSLGAAHTLELAAGGINKLGLSIGQEFRLVDFGGKK